MSNIDNMTDIELVAGLMRGDRRTHKMGYSAKNAAAAVLDLREDADERDLTIFAAGFTHGLNDGVNGECYFTAPDLPVDASDWIVRRS
jgi:hypothetical protein